MTEMTAAEIREENIYTIWDLYRDIHGMRPRWLNFDAMSDEELEKMAQDVCAEHDRYMAEREEEQKEAVAEFEGRVEELIEMGAKTRENAIKWLMDAEGDESISFFEYTNDLPYGYLAGEQL